MDGPFTATVIERGWCALSSDQGHMPCPGDFWQCMTGRTSKQPPSGCHPGAGPLGVADSHHGSSLVHPTCSFLRSWKGTLKVSSSYMMTPKLHSSRASNRVAPHTRLKAAMACALSKTPGVLLAVARSTGGSSTQCWGWSGAVDDPAGAWQVARPLNSLPPRVGPLTFKQVAVC